MGPEARYRSDTQASARAGPWLDTAITGDPGSPSGNSGVTHLGLMNQIFRWIFHFPVSSEGNYQVEFEKGAFPKQTTHTRPFCRDAQCSPLPAHVLGTRTQAPHVVFDHPKTVIFIFCSFYSASLSLHPFGESISLCVPTAHLWALKVKVKEVSPSTRVMN